MSPPADATAALTARQRGAATLVAATAALAVASQVALVLARLPAGGSAAVALANTFSYFTILTNGLTACVVGLLAWRGAFDRPSCAPGTLSAVTAYILVVSLIYEVLLRVGWSPVDAGMLSDFALHDAVPALTLLFWLLVVPKGRLRWRQPVLWLGFPLAYIVYTTARGAITGWYPYPFVDIARLGYTSAFTNAAGIVLVFWLAGIVLVAADRVLGAGRRRS